MQTQGVNSTSSAWVTDITPGGFTTRSTRELILHHTVSRIRGRGKNQCNYSKKNDFSYKCRSSGVPSLNCAGRARPSTAISVIIMSANINRQEEDRFHRLLSPTSHGELAVQLGVHLFVPLVAPHLVHSLSHHRNRQNKTLRSSD